MCNCGALYIYLLSMLAIIFTIRAINIIKHSKIIGVAFRYIISHSTTNRLNMSHTLLTIVGNVFVYPSINYFVVQQRENPTIPPGNEYKLMMMQISKGYQNVPNLTIVIIVLIFAGIDTYRELQLALIPRYYPCLLRHVLQCHPYERLLYKEPMQLKKMI